MEARTKKLKVPKFHEHPGLVNADGSVNLHELRKFVNHAIAQAEAGHYAYQNYTVSDLPKGGVHVAFDYVHTDPSEPAH